MGDHTAIMSREKRGPQPRRRLLSGITSFRSRPLLRLGEEGAHSMSSSAGPAPPLHRLDPIEPSRTLRASSMKTTVAAHMSRMCAGFVPTSRRPPAHPRFYPERRASPTA